ncbi:outer membrane protein assembly factor BamB [Thalassotalea profundi]|uniref:Outer membrane protein assembly factor BamB n=1 Tax=Thalassotalea profundi TaxID=2036687 RepID=A0ABQ3J038_9GAMM|nr:outer membrane protein assembly factor BamB [Thalassotalea profundi]GHE94498.1 outer membrane protein assembly factor BamB [Thalassotalea profundi]
MPSLNKKLLVILFMSIGLAACSSTEDEIDPNEPAELVDIQAKFEPKVVWDQSVGGVDDYYSQLRPIVAYDKVFTASREGDAYAFDLLTGKKVWHKDLSDLDNARGFFSNRTSALISGGPTAGINQIFLGSENGIVYALEADNGSVVWQGKVKGEVIAAPAFDQGTVVVNTSSGVMKSFNASTGEDGWQIEQDVPALTLRGISAPTTIAGGVLVGTADGLLVVYILENGQQGWTVEVGEATGSTELERVIDVDAAPVAYDDKVYAISARGHLAAVDLRSGRKLWERQYSSFYSVSIDGNNLYLTDIKGHVYAIDRLNGLERWSQLALTNRGVTGPAVVGDYVVVGDFEGYLHWISQESGDIVARHHVDGSGLNTTPTVVNDLVIVQSRDGDLEAIKAP